MMLTSTLLSHRSSIFKKFIIDQCILWLLDKGFIISALVGYIYDGQLLAQGIYISALKLKLINANGIV